MLNSPYLRLFETTVDTTAPITVVFTAPTTAVQRRMRIAALEGRQRYLS